MDHEAEPVHGRADHRDPARAGGGCGAVVGTDGGNEVVVLYARRTVGSPLHSYWDTPLVKKLGTDEQDVADDLVAQFNSNTSAWMQGRAADWAQEAFGKARDVAYNLPNRRVRDGNGDLDYRLSDDYEEDALAVASAQIAKAGMRLAMILNDALR